MANEQIAERRTTQRRRFSGVTGVVVDRRSGLDQRAGADRRWASRGDAERRRIERRVLGERRAADRRGSASA